MTPNVAYLSPAWGLVPTKEQSAGLHPVHARVSFADEDAVPVVVTHNLDLAYGAPLAENKWVSPLVLVNLQSGGAAAPLHTINPIDGNSLQFGRVASGPGTAAVYDVWIFRGHKAAWYE
jgi:hypothetical protein